MGEHLRLQAEGVAGGCGWDWAEDVSPFPSLDENVAAVAASVYRARQRRARHFCSGLFSEPAWDMLLDLFVNKALDRRVSTTSLCVAAGAPPATGTRWIALLEQHQLVRRYRTVEDRRLSLVEITSEGYQMMSQYVSEEIVNSRNQRSPDVGVTRADALSRGLLPDEQER